MYYGIMLIPVSKIKDIRILLGKELSLFTPICVTNRTSIQKTHYFVNDLNIIMFSKYIYETKSCDIQPIPREE